MKTNITYEIYYTYSNEPYRLIQKKVTDTRNNKDALNPCYSEEREQIGQFKTLRKALDMMLYYSGPKTSFGIRII